MSVSSKKKKYKNNDNTNKVNDSIKQEENNNINIEDTCQNTNLEFNDSNNEILGDIKLNEEVILDRVNTNNKSFKKICSYIFLMLIIILTILLVLFFPRIKLSGEKEMVITYKDKYVEPGYRGYIFNKDITDKIRIISSISNGVIGKYEIIYYIDLFGIKIRKSRIVNIVDRDNPKIIVNSEVINVCPNQEIPDFDYEAFDEYEGDITDRVERIINDSEVLLKVSDSSNNNYELSVKIDKNDKVNPVINLKGDSVMYLNYGNEYIEPGYTVSDNCDSELDDKVLVNGSVGRDIGTYTITYEVMDSSGNKGVATRKVIVRGNIKNSGVINNGSIYLTFDDGPNQGTTNKILDILNEEGVKATFFVTCNGPDSLIKRMYEEGHTVALHTASHNYSYIYSSVDNYFADLNKVRDRVKNITGNDSKIIRFPGGSSNTVSRNYKLGIMTELSYLVLNDGYRYFDWNVDAMDASSAKNSGDVYYNVTSNLYFNRMNVVLMHDTKSITVDALRNIIKFGKEKGYSFNKIDMNTYMVRHGINN